MVRRGVGGAGESKSFALLSVSRVPPFLRKTAVVLVAAGALVVAFAAVGAAVADEVLEARVEDRAMPASALQLPTSAILPHPAAMLIEPLMFAGGSVRAVRAARRQLDQVVLAGSDDAAERLLAGPGQCPSARRTAASSRRCRPDRRAAVVQLDEVVVIRRVRVAAAAVDLADDDVARRSRRRQTLTVPGVGGAAGR